MHGYRDNPISWNFLGDALIRLKLIDDARLMLCIRIWHPRRKQIDEHDDMFDNPEDDGRMGSRLALRDMKAKAHRVAGKCSCYRTIFDGSALNSADN